MSHHRAQYSHVHEHITFFWNVTPCNLMLTDVSEERTASIFKAEESHTLLLWRWKSYVPPKPDCTVSHSWDRWESLRSRMRICWYFYMPIIIMLCCFFKFTLAVSSALFVWKLLALKVLFGLSENGKHCPSVTCASFYMLFVGALMHLESKLFLFIIFHNLYFSWFLIIKILIVLRITVGAGTAQSV
jgi:hypothetical protein